MRGLAEAVAGRGQGAVHWLYRQVSGPDYSPGPLLARLGDLLAGAALLPVADQLLEVDAARAALILGVSLQFDLAYNAQVLPAEQVTQARDAFFAALGSGARFFTNRLPDPDATPDRPLGYDRIPCSTATFDSLVLGIEDRLAALVCVQDED